MAATSRQNPYYYISQAAITISPNAVDGDPSYVAVSIVTGTLIMLSVKHYAQFVEGLDYTADQQNPTWRLSGYSTKLQDEYADKQVYIYARLVADASNGLLVFSDEDYTSTISADGNSSDPGIAKKDNYIYVKLGYLTAPYSGKRDVNWDSGCLLTQYAEDTKDEFGELFKLVNDFIVPQKAFYNLTVKKLLTALDGLKLNGKWFFNSYEITNIKAYADYENLLGTVISATDDFDKYLPSMKLIFSYINNHLRKDIDSIAKGKITFAGGINLDNQDITGVDVESDVPDGGIADAKDTSIPTTAAMVKHTQEYGDANYLSKVKDDTAKGKITFEEQQQFDKGFEVGNFTPGVADGTGGAFRKGEDGNVHLTTDYLNVRRKARFNDVEILTTHHIGGAQMSSAASCKIDHVVTRVDGVYQCFFRKTNSDGRIITNDWKKGDQAYCNTFNLQEQADGTKGNHFFWRLVVSTDAVTGTLASGLGETFDASEYHCVWMAMNNCAEGSDDPQAGDEVVLLGHQPQSGETEADYAGRQSAIYQVASGEDGRPYYRQYVGIDSYSLDGCLEQQMMPNNNIFKGKVVVTGEGWKGLQNEAGEDLGDLSYSATNMLRNTGFYGEGKSADINANTMMNVDTETLSPSLEHWTTVDAQSIAFEDSPSGYAVEFNGVNASISQATESVFPKETYIVSFQGTAGTEYTVSYGGVETSVTAESRRTKVKIVATENPSNTFSISCKISGSKVYGLLLERGTVASNNWVRSVHDVNPEIYRLQNLQYLANAIRNGSTTVNGGLILSNIIQLGKFVDGVLKQVTSGVSGVYNSSADVALWSGGTFEHAGKTVAKLLNNPFYNPTEEELAEMAKFVVTHGGTAILNEAIVRGTVYATNGIFNGEVNASSGVFKNVVINGAYNRLVQTVDDSNYNNFLYNTGDNNEYYALLLQWGDVIHLNLTSEDLRTAPQIMLPTSIPFYNDIDKEVQYSNVLGYKRNDDDSITPMDIDDLRSLVGRKIVIHADNVRSDLLLNVGNIYMETSIPPNDDGQEFYLTSPEQGSWVQSVTDGQIYIGNGETFIMECLLAKRRFPTDPNDPTKGWTIAEMICWSVQKITMSSKQQAGNIIAFKVNCDGYPSTWRAEKGMTWANFVDDISYSNEQFSIDSNNNVCFNDGDSWDLYHDFDGETFINNVKADEVINEGDNYYAG